MALALAAVPALALTDFSNAPSGAHYRQGSAEPECTVNADRSVECTGTTIGGVGNTNAFLDLDVTVSANLTCTNKGGNVVEPHSGTFSDSVEATLTPNRNGQIVVGAVETDPITNADILRDFTCPNGKNWTDAISGTPTTSYSYTITFDGEQLPAISLP
jgi:hypothetical protein